MKEPFAYRIHRYLNGSRGHHSAEESENISGTRLTSEKKYPRMSRIALPMETIDMPLGKALERRSSMREFDPDSVVSKRELGILLGNALGMREDGQRRYPSGGALYPIETYVIAQNVEDVLRGVHHYHPRSHSLEHLWKTEKLSLFIPRVAWANDASVILIFTALWHRNYKKYADFGYLLGILEAGHMAQNVLLAAAALGIDACPLKGFHHEAISQVLDIDESSEQPVYSIALGKE